jgi:hypothetical protein
MKKCPPGVFCVENVTLSLLFIILLVLIFLIYINAKSTNIKEKTIINNEYSNPNPIPIGYSGKDVLLNPYDAPYKDERYLNLSLKGLGINLIPTNAIPINVPTNIGSVPLDTSYRQMGIITPLNGASKDNILPLMGRPLFTNRDKWQYYTISNQHNNVKLPISFKGRSALNDYGVDKIYDGDTIYVEGYNEAFKVTVYENDTIRYLPFV